MGLRTHSRWDEGCPDYIVLASLPKHNTRLNSTGEGRGRLTRARAHSIDADAIADLLVAKSTSEGNDGTFGACVIEQIGPADVWVDRGAGDDGVALLHVWEGVFGEEEEGVDVSVKGLNPLFSGSDIHVRF